MKWAVRTLHGIAEIIEIGHDGRTAGHVIVVEDGLSPHHARRIVIAHNLVVDTLTEHAKEDAHGHCVPSDLRRPV